MMKKILLLSLLFVSIAFAEKTHNPIYIDAVNGNDDTGAGTASQPYQSLGKAIDVAVDGDSILIKAGTYTGSLNRNLTINEKLYIYSESGADSTIFDAEESNRHFYFNGTAVDTSFKLIGITLRNGKPNSTDNGGSILINNGSTPVFANCIFESNKTKHTSDNNWKYGGAIYTSPGTPIIRDCTFKNNSTDAYGGALYIYSYNDTINTLIERTTFYGNTLEPYSNQDARGGAVYIDGSPKIVDCTFDSNLVKMNSSWNNYGGALYIYGSYVNTANTSSDTTIYVRRTIFKQNKVIEGSGGGGAKGGAIYVEGQRKVVIENSLFNSNEAVSAFFQDQWGSYNTNGEGGAVKVNIYDRYTGDSGYKPYNPVIFVNNTFVNNVAKGSGDNSGNGAAVYFDYREKAIFFNNIIWGSSVNNNTDTTRFDLRLDYSNDSEYFMSNNAFQYYDGNNYGGDNKKGVNPAFNSSSANPYSLHDRSPLIGAGLSTYEGYSAPTEDLTKATRPNPSGSSPDIGAYENTLSTSPYPTTVSGVTATVANQRVTLSWTANSESDMASYKVYQSRTSGFSSSADSLVATVTHPSSGTTATTTLSGLTNKTTYYYLITAVDTDGYEGSASTEVSAMPYYKGPTWYVATSANGGSDSNEGSSFAPFFSLKMAVDSASTGDTISIGAGTHQYTSSSYWNIDFNGSKSLIIKGQGKSSTILDAQSKDRHFYFSMNTAALDTNFKVMDLTLKNGQPSSQNGGGSVWISAKWDQSSTSWSTSGPLFQNVNFESNQSKTGTGEWDYNDGGAVYIDTWAAPYFRNVEFNYNINRGRGGAVYKNGDWNSRGNSPTFENCTFNGNESDAGAYQWQASGGAVFMDGPASFTSCVFDSNKVTTNSNNSGYGGAVSVSMSYNNQSSDRLLVRFDNCTFSYNSVVPGSNGGQTGYGGAFDVSSRSALIMTNSLFYKNKTEGGVSVQQWGTNYNSGQGGAINVNISREWNNSTNNYEYKGYFVLINSTITDNEAKGASNNGHGGAIYFHHGQQAYLFNNIVWGNTAHWTDDEQNSFYINRGNNDFRWSNNSIQYVDASSFGDNNLNLNPEFVGSGSTPYALHDRSTLIGAGTSSFESYSAPTTDITGVANSRPNPSGSNPDLGAYENSLSTTPYPSQVSGLKAKGGNGSVTLSWTANSETNMAKYYVYRDTASFTTGSANLIDSTTTTTYTNTGLNNATRYYFRVAAVNSLGYVGAASQSIDITPAYTGPVWYMAVADSGGSDSNEGSEVSPVLTLSKAVEKAATGDTILIGDGTYTGSSNREIMFDGSKKLVIKSINGKDKTIFDAGGFGRHLVLNINDASYSIDTTFVIEGITFKNGGKQTEGGSVRIIGFNGWNQSTQRNVTVLASPKFKNCDFYGNNASWHGGAAYINNGDPIFESCLFDSNSVDGTDNGIHGGAVYVNDGSPEFRSTTFKQNKAYLSGSIHYSVEGGAIYFSGPKSAKIVNCTFTNNLAYSNVDGPNGGAVFVGDNYDITNNEELTIDRSRFYGNTNEAPNGGNNRGGALYIRGGIKITNSLFYDNHVYSGGTGFWPTGGAISFEIHGRHNQNTNQQEYPKTYLINNTIVNNSTAYNVGANEGKLAGSGGGINMHSSNNLHGVWFNNIIWSNDAESNKDIEWDNQTPLIFDHNVVKDVYSGIPITETLYSKDPKFTDTTNHVYTLSEASYLIGKGVSSFDGIYAPTQDIDGNMRPNPSGSSPDIGAFENSLEQSPYPSQVSNLQAKGSHKYVSLTWDSNTETDIASYTVYMSTLKDFIPSASDSIGTTETNSFTTVDTLQNKTEYHFAVAAVNDRGNMGEHSEVIRATPYYRGPKWYVAVDGNNANDGDVSAPLSDLRTAVDSAKSGHQIILLAGTHTGPNNREITFGRDQGSAQENEVKQLTIQGDPDASVDEVILDAEWGGRHFQFKPSTVDTSFVIRNITFTRGNGRSDGGNWNLAGSIGLEGGTYWDDGTQQNVEGYPEPKFVNCVWKNNHVGNDQELGAGGAIGMRDASPRFYNCKFENNSATARGGAVYVQSFDSQHTSNPIFKNCLFKWNAVDARNESASGGAVAVENGGTAKFIRTRFESNVVRSPDGWNAHGAAVHLWGGWHTDAENNILFNQCVFTGNFTEAKNNGAFGGAIHASSPFSLVNSLIYKNVGKANHGGGGGLVIQIEDRDGVTGRSLLVNNTIAGNEFKDNSGNYAHGGGGIYVMNDNQDGLWFNNIIYGNRSGNDNSILLDGNPNIDMAYLNVDDEEGKSWFNAETMTTHKPKFKNPGGEDFRLSFTSQLIDAGVDSYGGENAPKVDIRNYYRLGTTDMGAYEFGASKYILELADDISPISRDTTYLSRDQEFNVTIKTNDNQGNIVTAEENLKWFIAPTDKHVTIVESDTVTSNGEASVKVKATGITGFKFRIGVDIADAVRVTDLYIIERQVTGAPPPVTEIAINPADWTNQNNFTISWTNPDEGAYGREFLGAVVKLGDEYPEYINRTSETQFDVNSVSVKVPEMGEWTYKVWLVDELGNDSEDSASVVTAKLDVQPPDEFWLHYPSPDVWESDKPRFHWSEGGDYPSGIKEFHIFLNQNHYAKFSPNDATHNEANEEFYIDAPSSIPDGNHSWHMEAWDFADNIRWSSDTVYFGVDITAPNINHSNPLTVVDEGSTTPAINVSVSDGASGVKETFLYYCRSGGGGGFVSVDMSSGSYSIPGGDVKSDGLEYYIESEDNVGNTRYWPAEGEFHSVKVRTENSVSTAARWPSGVPGGTDSTNYVFFSIPFDVGNAKSAITSVLDPNNEGPNEFNYRLYGYSNGWQENPSSVTMGNGYFLIYDPGKYEDNPQMHFDFGQGTSTPTEPPYGFGVTTGQWKFFGSPYNFNVSLDNVYTEDGTNIRDAGSIYTWNSSWSSAGSSLQPWKGYIFKSGGATKLNIDVRGSTFGKMTKAMNPDDYPMDANEWIVDMIATTGNARDELNSVGVRSFASDGYDPLDEFEPPGVPGDVVLRIDNRNRQETPDLYAKDIRKPNEEGHYWDIQVFAPTNGQRTYITFEGLGYIPEEYDVFLINKTTKQAKNLEWDAQYRFANTGSESYLKQELRLVVGTKKFVEDNNAGVSLYPDAFTLAQNYPNPFNPQTSIMISLEEDAQVDLIIYNLLGEEITRLAHNEHRPAGYYNFIWNGRNNLGDKVSTGVYFYHALIRNGQGKVVLNKTRKMIFLK